MKSSRLILLLPILLAACSQPAAPVIDGSSEGAYVTSLQEAREALSAPDRLRFEAALKVIQGQEFAAAKNKEEFSAAMRARLAGKTADQVIAEGAAATGNLKDKAVDAMFDAKGLISQEAARIKDAAKGE